MRVVHSRVQHGVGQGSFHSATVEVFAADASHYRFDYVYDCGALVGQTISPALKRSIARMDLAPRHGSGGRPVIDALVLSHFDRDHIIGASLLVKKCDVKLIYMPYLSPVELALVLASQAEGLEAIYVGALHQLANGGDTFLGVPVAMVRIGGERGDLIAPANPPGPAPLPEGDAIPDRQEWPSSLEPLDATTGQPLGRDFDGAHNVGLGATGQAGRTPWILRFWNRGIDNDLLAHLFDQLVMCDFPIAALDAPSGSGEIVDWLEDSANRKVVLKAYCQAIAAHKPLWLAEASSQRLANFLSLALYSGPTNDDLRPTLYRAVDYGCCPESLAHNFYWIGERRRRHVFGDYRYLGWLGTGDAPLGETGVWADFQMHFADELGRVVTVQVPHHGAAPIGGPKFFHSGLLGEAVANAVISVGTNNTYGHPKATVLKEILSEDATLVIVTEDSRYGFHEVCNFAP